MPPGWETRVKASICCPLLSKTMKLLVFLQYMVWILVGPLWSQLFDSVVLGSWTQELWRCGTEGHGLEGIVGMGLDDLRGFFQSNDIMILCLWVPSNSGSSMILWYFIRRHLLRHIPETYATVPNPGHKRMCRQHPSYDNCIVYGIAQHLGICLCQPFRGFEDRLCKISHLSLFCWLLLNSILVSADDAFSLWLLTMVNVIPAETVKMDSIIKLLRLEKTF